MKTTVLCFAFACGSICGCATETPYLDSQLGMATAHMVQAQTLDPATAANPARLAPAGADGQRIKNAIDLYHGDINKEGAPASRQVSFESGANSSR